MPTVRVLHQFLQPRDIRIVREISNRAEFGLLLNDLGLTGAAAEIGVHRGEFSKSLLDTWNGERLFLIDPWLAMDDYANDSLNDGDRNADRMACMELLAQHADRCIEVRMLSADAVSTITRPLDFVYIDGNHNEDFVMQDLAIWYPHVRSGGIFAGHDYLSTVTWPHVQKAVNEFAAEHGIAQINLTWETGGSWWWRKPA